MILIACFSTTSLAQSTPEQAFTLLKSKPSINDIQKLYVPHDDKSGWFVFNSFRESLVNTAMLECKKREASHIEKTVSDSCKFPLMLQEIPATDRIQKEYYPVTNDKGWWVHNQYRENLINLKLKECEKLEDEVLPICEETMYENELPLWQEPGSIVAMVALSILAGFVAGFKMSK